MTDEALRDFLRPLLPGGDIRCAAEPGAAAEIDMPACVKLAPGLARALPGLRLVQKLGAGVDAIVGDPELAPENVQPMAVKGPPVVLSVMKKKPNS